MTEREQIGIVAEAEIPLDPLDKYLILLDYYGILPKVQEVVFDVIATNLDHNPETTIRQIESWWKETFDNNGPEGPAGEKSNGNGSNGREAKETRREAALEAMDDAQAVIYWHRENWKKRFYRRDVAGSERKASRRNRS